MESMRVRRQRRNARGEHLRALPRGPQTSRWRKGAPDVGPPRRGLPTRSSPSSSSNSGGLRAGGDFATSNSVGVLYPTRISSTWSGLPVPRSLPPASAVTTGYLWPMEFQHPRPQVPPAPSPSAEPHHVDGFPRAPRVAHEASSTRSTSRAACPRRCARSNGRRGPPGLPRARSSSRRSVVPTTSPLISPAAITRALRRRIIYTIGSDHRPFFVRDAEPPLVWLLGVLFKAKSALRPSFAASG
jgi:hypothetical protein